MDPDVPLVVAEVNPDDMRNMPKGIASCPNCTTMIPVTALAPLHRAARIDRMVVSTYQSVSGRGPGRLARARRAVDQARRPLRGARGAPGASRVSSCRARCGTKPIAGNVIPLAGSVKEQGYTSEEWKMVRESRKILHDDEIRCTVTCVRVPVYVGHAVSANVRFHRPMTQGRGGRSAARRAGRARSSTTATAIPTPQEAAGIDPVLVGRIREDPSEPGSLDLWITGDNLRKGAALNGVQMAELLLDL